MLPVHLGDSDPWAGRGEKWGQAFEVTSSIPGSVFHLLHAVNAGPLIYDNWFLLSTRFKFCKVLRPRIPVEEGGSLWVWASQSYIVRPCLKKQKQETENKSPGPKWTNKTSKKLIQTKRKNMKVETRKQFLVQIHLRIWMYYRNLFFFFFFCYCLEVC